MLIKLIVIHLLRTVTKMVLRVERELGENHSIVRDKGGGFCKPIQSTETLVAPLRLAGSS